MRWFVVALVAVLIAVGTWWKRPDSPSANDTAAPMSNAGPGGIMPANATSDTDLRPRGMSEPLPASDGETLARLQSEKAKEREDIDRLLAAGRDKLVGRYESETIDKRWADAKKLELAQFTTSAQIEAINVQPGNLDIDCRRSVCRIGADFASRSAAQDWATLYLTNMGARLPKAFFEMSDNTDGSAHIDVYGLARQ